MTPALPSSSEGMAKPNQSGRFHLVDGHKAIRILHQSGEFAAGPRPGLVLLDVLATDLHGLAIPSVVKSDPAW